MTVFPELKIGARASRRVTSVEPTSTLDFTREAETTCSGGSGPDCVPLARLTDPEAVSPRSRSHYLD